ncbi:MAG: cyanophycinase [Gemmatimonadota bacterium]|nr:cyanophycinase [Gemmatimonadota bacterium]
MSRGYTIAIGGAEERLRDPAILGRFVEVCGGREARIAIIPTASRLSDTGPRYERVFDALGVSLIRVLPLATRADCDDPRWLKRVDRADGVFFTGGNQLKLSTTIGGTGLAELIRRRNLEDGLHVAGTSAGAAILSEHMIAFGDEGSTPRADSVTLAPGLGLAPEFIIDQHFRQRDRLGRLLTAIAYNPRLIGIGLDEDTAAFIAPHQTLTVRGSGAITVVDGTDLEYSSMDSSHEHDPVCMLNARVHILTEGASFDASSGRAQPPPVPRDDTDSAREAAS